MTTGFSIIWPTRQWGTHLLVESVQGSHRRGNGGFGFREVCFGVALLDADLW